MVSSPNDPDLVQMDSKIAELTRQIAEDQGVIKQAESELKTLNSTLSIEELSAQLEMVSFLFQFSIQKIILTFTLELSSCKPKMRKWNLS